MSQDHSQGEETAPTNTVAAPLVSAIITTFNEEDSIAACIESVLWCDEILVVDSYSTDRTPEIAQAYDKVRFLQHTYFGAGAQKNWAIPNVNHDWIFILDADELCTPELQKELRQLLASGPEFNAYTINRRVYFLGRVIRFSGWQHDRVTRLFRAGTAYYQNRRVHSLLKTSGPAPILKNVIDHYMVERSYDEYVVRTSKYAYWGAAQLWRNGRRSTMFQVVVRSLWRFIRTYFVQLGFLDGSRGVVFCGLQSYGTFMKWAILWGWHVNSKRGYEPALPEFEEDEDLWQGLRDIEENQ